MDWATPQNQIELWQIYVKGLQKLGQLWVELLRQSLESMNSAAIGDRSTLSKLTNLY